MKEEVNTTLFIVALYHRATMMTRYKMILVIVGFGYFILMNILIGISKIKEAYNLLLSLRIFMSLVLN